MKSNLANQATEEENTEGVKYCGLAKTSHKGFCLAMMEKPTKEWTGGSHIVS